MISSQLEKQNENNLMYVEIGKLDIKGTVLLYFKICAKVVCGFVTLLALVFSSLFVLLV